MNNDDAMWRDAEARVTDEFKRAGHPPTQLVRHLQTPGLLSVRYERGEDYRLVHDGAVVKKKGVASLAEYLKGSRFLERAESTTDDFRLLLLVLAAWPPVEHGDTYMNDPAHAELQPRLTFADKGARFTLAYPLGGGGGGSRTDPFAQRATVWTLTIKPDYHLEWQSAIVHYRDEL